TTESFTLSLHAALPICFGDAPNAGDVSPVEVSSQSEFRVVRQGNRLRIRFEPEERRDWAEGLFTRNGHLRRDAGKNGRLKKAARSEEHTSELQSPDQLV